MNPDTPTVPITKDDQDKTLNQYLGIIASNVMRLATIGGWPETYEPDTLLERVPRSGNRAPGFDAAIACALNMIPRDRQRLSAQLHCAWTPESVQQIRHETLVAQTADSETSWWLAACSVCDEDLGVDRDQFLAQVEQFQAISKDSELRLKRAIDTFQKMKRSFTFNESTRSPMGFSDGCIQAAYTHGHRFGVRFDANANLYFIGTYLPSLGLEKFSWSDERDEKGVAKSGPMHGSKQYVKCASFGEFQEAMKVVHAYLEI